MFNLVSTFESEHTYCVRCISSNIKNSPRMISSLVHSFGAGDSAATTSVEAVGSSAASATSVYLLRFFAFFLPGSVSFSVSVHVACIEAASDFCQTGNSWALSFCEVS